MEINDSFKNMFDVILSLIYPLVGQCESSLHLFSNFIESGFNSLMQILDRFYYLAIVICHRLSNYSKCEELMQ